MDKKSSPKSKTVRVELGERSYDIHSGSGNLAQAGKMIAGFPDVSHVVLMTDHHVEPLYAETVAESVTAEQIALDMLVVEAGEESKSLATASAIWEKLLELNATRKTVVVAVGGGVVGDLAGFIASTYLRGLRFFQIPTTLLAQVDSSVGGKVGINLPEAKNMIGAFHQPIGVLIDTRTLKTLDLDQYRSGVGEILKYAVSLDAQLRRNLEKNHEKINRRNTQFLSEIIMTCCRIKADIVQADERETTGLRAKLNYGHTFAHAYEKAAGYGVIPHGIAVAAGCVDAAKLALLLGRVDRNFLETQIEMNSMLDLPDHLEFDHPEELIPIMTHDKKNTGSGLNFVLPRSLGDCELVENVPIDLVRKVFENDFLA